MLVGDIKMEIKKKSKFRIVVKDLKTNKTKIITIYENHNETSFLEFVENLKKKIKEL